MLTGLNKVEKIEVSLKLDFYVQACVTTTATVNNN